MRACRLPFLLVFVLLLAACKPSDEGAAAGMRMRVYPVPSERAQGLADSLNQALAAGTDRALGTASLGAAGQLIVLAPDSLHPSIEKSLQDIVAVASASGANPLPQLRLRFWSVDALPGAGEDSPGLELLAPALEQVRAAGSAMHFALRDHIDSVSTVEESVSRMWASDTPGASQGLQYRIKRPSFQNVLELVVIDARNSGLESNPN